MKSYNKKNNRAQVVQVYQRCRTILSNELGVEPTDVTTRLYQELCEPVSRDLLR